MAIRSSCSSLLSGREFMELVTHKKFKSGKEGGGKGGWLGGEGFFGERGGGG